MIHGGISEARICEFINKTIIERIFVGILEGILERLTDRILGEITFRIFQEYSE